MPKASRFPNHPVRVLRKTLGFSSAEAFAKFTGIPAETIRNFEQGRRAVTFRVAVQIGMATGVLYSWLMTGNQAKGPPIDPMLEPLTKDVFEAFAGISPRREDENYLEISIGNQFLMIESLLRAASRKKRLPPCSYFLSIAFRDAVDQFNLERETREEMLKLNPESPLIAVLKVIAARLKTKSSSRRQQRKGKSASSARRPSA